MVRQRDLREAIRVHPKGFGERNEATSEDGIKWNPRLHVQLHATVLGQLARSDKIQTVVEYLCNREGLHRHAAIHVLSKLIRYSMRTTPDGSNPLSDQRYIELLNEIVNPDSSLYQQYVKPHLDGSRPYHPKLKELE